MISLRELSNFVPLASSGGILHATRAQIKAMPVANRATGNEIRNVLIASLVVYGKPAMYIGV
ncbi:hypothetical protein E3A20_22720, partial [Planctomyces bekefii]